MAFVKFPTAKTISEAKPVSFSITGALDLFHATEQKGQYAGQPPRYGVFTVKLSEGNSIAIQGLIDDIAQVTEGYDKGDEITVHYSPRAVQLPSKQIVQNNDLLIPAVPVIDADETQHTPEALAEIADLERQAELDAQQDMLDDNDGMRREYRNIDTLADEVEPDFDDDIPF